MTDEIMIQPAVPASALPAQARRAARGAAPVCRAVTCPRRSTSSVGMAWAPNRCEIRGELPAFTLTSLTWPARSRASCPSAGLTIRQGPHQGARKPTRTGTLAAPATSLTRWCRQHQRSTAAADDTCRNGVSLPLPPEPGWPGRSARTGSARLPWLHYPRSRTPGWPVNHRNGRPVDHSAAPLRYHSPLQWFKQLTRPSRRSARMSAIAECRLRARISGRSAHPLGAQVALDLLEGCESEATRLHFVRTRPLPLPTEPLRSAVIQLTRNRLAAADRRDGRRGLWLGALDRLGLGFGS